MGRKATHIGQQVTLEEMMKDEHEFSPHTDQLTMDSAAPLTSDKDGKYPVPEPGKKRTEY